MQFSDEICPTSGQDPQFSNIIFKINKLDLLWVPSFIALGIYFIFGTKFSWNGWIDTCFNFECVLLGRNFDFFGGYLVVTARYLVVTGGFCLLLVVTACYLVVTGGYCSLPGGYCSLLVVTASYRSLLLVANFSMNEKNCPHIKLLFFHIQLFS